MDEEDTGRVVEYYDALSRSYDELYGQEQAPKHRMIQELLKGRRFVLAVDVGCGTGKFLLQAGCSFQTGIGIDLSWEMLKKAQSRKSPKVHLIMADASSLPIKNGAADLIVSVSLTEAESTLPKMLAELGRIAGRSTTLALTVFQQQGSKQLQLLRVERWTKISDRENLYLVQLNPGENK